MQSNMDETTSNHFPPCDVVILTKGLKYEDNKTRGISRLTTAGNQVPVSFPTLPALMPSGFLKHHHLHGLSVQPLQELAQAVACKSRWIP